MFHATLPVKRGSDRSRLPLILVSALILPLLLMLSSQAMAGKWRGSTETIDGVPHVKNTEQAMKKATTITPEELWRIGGDTDDEDEFFGIIVRIIADEDGNVYLLDGQLNEIKIFSPDGEFLRSIGSEGEGPGQFRGPSSMFFMPGGDIGVIQQTPGKIIGLGRDGIPVDDHPVPVPEGAGFIALFGGFSTGGAPHLIMGVNNFNQGLFTQTRSLVKVGPDGNVLSTFTQADRTIDFTNAVIDELIWDGFERRWALGKDGTVFASEGWGEYQVSVFDTDGNKKMVIEQDCQKRKRDQEEQDRVHSIYEAFTRQVPGAQVKVSDIDHPISTLFVRDDGKLWVISTYGSTDLPDGVLGVFDVFDTEGRFEQQVTVKGQGNPNLDGYFFVDDRLYVVTGFLEAAMVAQGGGGDTPVLDEDAEPMAVICYELDI